MNVKDKKYRHKDNPREKLIYDVVTKWDIERLSRIVYGSDERGRPLQYLTHEERLVIINAFQWLGSPVGRKVVKEEFGFD